MIQTNSLETVSHGCNLSTQYSSSQNRAFQTFYMFTIYKRFIGVCFFVFNSNLFFSCLLKHPSLKWSHIPDKFWILHLSGIFFYLTLFFLKQALREKKLAFPGGSNLAHKVSKSITNAGRIVALPVKPTDI